MSEQTSQEPTMEEILASIRRIISEDEAPADDGAPAAPEAEPAKAEEALPIPDPEPEPEPVAAAEEIEIPSDDDGDDDADLELTQKVETLGDLDFVAPSAIEPEPAPPPPPAVAPPSGEGLVSDAVAAATAATFGRLSSNVLMPAEGRTLEDVVRELLRPLLQQWLDDNLPGIVQQAVEAEVDRISRGRVR